MLVSADQPEHETGHDVRPSRSARLLASASSCEIGSSSAGVRAISTTSYPIPPPRRGESSSSRIRRATSRRRRRARFRATAPLMSRLLVTPIREVPSRGAAKAISAGLAKSLRPRTRRVKSRWRVRRNRFFKPVQPREPRGDVYGVSLSRPLRRRSRSTRRPPRVLMRVRKP